MAGEGTSPGTFGELLQGVLPSNQHFLVTLPVDLHTRATFVCDSDLDEVVVFPPHKTKSHALADQLLRHHGIAPGGWLTLASPLPEGKGMASSSADLVATARAIDSCFRIGLSADDIGRHMARIEPSDGVMYPGATVFFHRQVRLQQVLGDLPPLTIVGIDEGGTIDTISFNSRPTVVPDAWKARYAELLDDLAGAIRLSDLRRIGAVATRSAEMSQAFNPKSTFDKVRGVCDEVGGLGVAVGHSGTCLGVLIARHVPQHREQLNDAMRKLRALGKTLIVCRTTRETEP